MALGEVGVQEVGEVSESLGGVAVPGVEGDEEHVVGPHEVQAVEVALSGGEGRLGPCVADEADDGFGFVVGEGAVELDRDGHRRVAEEVEGVGLEGRFHTLTLSQKVLDNK